MTDPLYGDVNDDGTLGDIYLHPVVYKGEQLFNFLYYNRQSNEYFDGAYGGYFIDLMKSDGVASIIAAQDDDDTVESMMNTFKGWQLPTFIVKSQSTEFSHASKYPYKVRFVPANNFQAIILHEVLLTNSWKKIAVFYSDDTDGLDCYTNFQRSAKDYSVEIIFVGHAMPNENVDYTSQVKSAIKTGATIFVLFMRNQQQSIFLSQAHRLGLLNDKTQIIGATFSKDSTPVVTYLASNGADIKVIILLTSILFNIFTNSIIILGNYEGLFVY